MNNTSSPPPFVPYSPSPPSLRDALARGLDLAKAGDWTAAERAFTEAIARSPGEWEAYVNRGNVRQEQGDLEAAIADFSRAIALDAAHVAPFFNRGNVRAMLGDLEGAIGDFSHAIRIDAAFARAYERRGHILQRLGEDERAESDFSRAIELAPQRHDAYAHRAAVRALRGAVDDALSDCDAALERVPPSARQRDAITRLKSALTRARHEVEDGARRRELGAGASAGALGRGLLAWVTRALDGADAEYRRAKGRSTSRATLHLGVDGADVRLVVDEEARTVALVLVVRGLAKAALRRAAGRAATVRGVDVAVSESRGTLTLTTTLAAKKRPSADALIAWIERSLRAADRRARAIVATRA